MVSKGIAEKALGSAEKVEDGLRKAFEGFQKARQYISARTPIKLSK